MKLASISWYRYLSSRKAISGSRKTEFDVNQDTHHCSYGSKKPKKHSKARTLSIFNDSRRRTKNARAFLHRVSSAVLLCLGFIRDGTFKIQNKLANRVGADKITCTVR